MGQHVTATSASLPGWGSAGELEAWVLAACGKAAPGVSHLSIDPDAFLPGLGERGSAAALLPETLPGRAAADALASFRGRNGASLVADAAGLSSLLAKTGPEPNPTLLWCRSLGDLEPLARLAPSGPVVAVLRDLSDPREPSAALLDWVQGCSAIDVGLRQDASTLRLLVLARGVGGDVLAEALRESLPEGWTCERLRRERLPAGGLGGLTSLWVTPGPTGLGGRRATLLRALDLVHDGGYRSEGDAAYSWIWTGPSAHFRIYVGQLRGVGGEARICVAATREARNLDEAVLMMDGRRLAHRLDRWSPTSGRFTAVIPPGQSRHSVLSIAVPVLASDDTGSRKLGICIDRVEIEA